MSSAIVVLFLIVTASAELGALPVGPFAPRIVPVAPKPNWNWDRIPTSFHGAVKDREFNETEVSRLARYQMTTIEKWYTPCASASAPHQSGPECAVEKKIEELFDRIRAQSKALGLPRPTAILYWNSMFDFAMYAAHQGMLDLEAQGVHAFLRDETGKVIELCNDGNVYCNVTTYDWTEPRVRELWVGTVVNATKQGIDGIFADHSAPEGTQIGFTGNPREPQGPNQLCNGKDQGRQCFNFTDEFRDSFNSWHMWATNYTQDLLSRMTGGPVIQGPLASMNNATTWGGNITDPSYCDFDGIREAQANSGMAVFEARGPCVPNEHCLAAYLAAVERGTYMHCTYNGDDLIGQTSFTDMDNYLGKPKGPAQETPAGSDIWVRMFASGTVVTYDNRKKIGTVAWA